MLSTSISADIYSLGATFHFLLTGEPPFPDGTIAQKLIKHQTAKPKAVTDLPRTFPKASPKWC